MMQVLVKLAPSLSQRSRMKRIQITNGFEEVEVERGQTMEVEGTQPSYLWLLI